MQAGIQPPTFVFFVNDPKLIGDDYKRYMERALRDNVGLSGKGRAFNPNAQIIRVGCIAPLRHCLACLRNRGRFKSMHWRLPTLTVLKLLTEHPGVSMDNGFVLSNPHLLLLSIVTVACELHLLNPADRVQSSHSPVNRHSYQAPLEGQARAGPECCASTGKLLIASMCGCLGNRLNDNRAFALVSRSRYQEGEEKGV